MSEFEMFSELLLRLLLEWFPILCRKNVNSLHLTEILAVFMA